MFFVYAPHFYWHAISSRWHTRILNHTASAPVPSRGRRALLTPTLHRWVPNRVGCPTDGTVTLAVWLSVRVSKRKI